MVFILCNLAYIPDSVCRSINFAKQGWSYDFRHHMDKYKEEFNSKEDRICDWKFQDDETEKAYTDFKESIDRGDDGLSERKLSKEE